VHGQNQLVCSEPNKKKFFGPFFQKRTLLPALIDVETYLARIARLNPDLNAFTYVDAAGARLAARQSADRLAQGAPLSPIDGMSVAIKANIAATGLPLHAGIGAFSDRVADRDAACVARLREGGAVILGTTNMDEAAFGATTDNPVFGRTQNPHRHGYTAGGSSGGAAAAVAAGLCAAALGTDTLGSARIPASYCGVFGHKPRHGRIDNTGVVPLVPAFDQVGILAENASTLTAALAWLTRDFATAERAAPLIGVLDPAGIDIAPDVAACFTSVVRDAAGKGMRVENMAKLSQDFRVLRDTALLVTSINAAHLHADELARNPQGFSEKFRALLAWGQSQQATRLKAARHYLAQARADIVTLFAAYDAVLMPTTPQTAFPFAADPPRNQADFTLLANIAGLAATAFPAGTNADGLPLSVQVVSAHDETCVAIAVRLTSKEAVLF
jgi:aspartyl-tRNA(Asn)/glutamyl-tRNA(Gln) amidotransferase subunit A